MMDAWRTEWANNKKDIAYKLNSGECGGSYGDAVLILCSVLSALAAEVWPGYGKDQKRFVELLKQFAPPKLETTKISVRLLIQLLSADEKRNDETLKLRKAFRDCRWGRVLIGAEVDKTEKEILEVCNTLSAKELRAHSYANLLYQEVRCGFIHEYKPGKRADSGFQAQELGGVYYVGQVDVCNPDAEQRIINFPVKWISELVTCVARNVDAQSSNLPFSEPSRWWVDGCSVS